MLRALTFICLALLFVPLLCVLLKRDGHYFEEFKSLTEGPEWEAGC